MSDDDLSALHAAARAYAARGWPVHPLRPHDKVPMTEHGCLDATTDLETVDAMWAVEPQANIGIRTGISVDALDIDGPEAAVVLREWLTAQDIDPAALRHTVSRTAKGWHYLFLPTGAGNRTGLLTARIDWRGTNGYIAVPPSLHPSGATYRWLIEPNGALPEAPQALRDLVLPPPRAPVAPERETLRTSYDVPPYVTAAFDNEVRNVREAAEGTRNSTLYSAVVALGKFVNGGHLGADVYDVLADAARSAGLDERETHRTIASAIAHNEGKVRDVPEQVHVRPPPARAVADAPDVATYEAPTEKDEMPRPSEAVYSGWVGEVVRDLDPWTEADPAAVLVSLLAGISACIGATPHVMVGTTRHPLLVWPILLGATANGRKGTAQDAAEAVLRAADPLFIERNVVGGLSSGEGLIWHVRDPEVEYTEDAPPKVVEAGVEDKRAWLIETEFGSTMARARRDGSSLAHVLRQGWDGRTLATLTKSRVIATGPHIVICAHITPREFLARMQESELAGGTYNRFLPILVRRSKLLPLAPPPPEGLLGGHGAILAKRMSEARQVGIMRRTPEADDLWSHLVYANVTEHAETADDRYGFFVARAIPNILRVAALYALTDGQREVHAEHVRAAEALVRFSMASVKRLLTTPEQMRLARLRSALHDAAERGLSRTEVSALYARKLTTRQLDDLLASCPGLEVARETTGGRPLVRYRLRTKGEETPGAEDVRP